MPIKASSSTLIWFWSLVFTMSLLLPSPTHPKTALSENELSDIRGKAGLAVDIEGISTEIDYLRYVDPDGDGTFIDGALSLEGISYCYDFGCSSSTISLTGATFDATSSATVNGSNQAALIMGIPETSSFDQLEIDAVKFGCAPGSCSSAPTGMGLLVHYPEIAGTLKVAAN